jgi:hypothetical protein
MAHDPAIKLEAFNLYLLGNSAAQIAAELKRRHGDGAGTKTPSAKTVENWMSAGSPTWSEKRYVAEAAAQDAVTKDFVSAKSKLISGMVRLQAKLQERAERVLDNAGDADPENLTQEMYACANLTKTLDKMLDSKLAEDVRRKDAIDCLIEACRRIVPSWESLEVKILQEFQRLVNQKASPAVQQS